MEWITAITEAIDYMENHMLEEITLHDVAAHVNLSPFYFHRGFLMLCGYSVTEYIRSRRLSLAGEELITSDISVLELALKYGYDSPDSFTKAFSRFHGYTPSAVRRNRTMVRAFAPLQLTISLKGGQKMDYRITKKEAFTVLGVSREIRYENAERDVSAFWQEYAPAGAEGHISGMFGINIDPQMGQEKFEYLIADLYHPAVDIPEGLTVRTIPAFTWAVFPCRGALPKALEGVDKKIFSEWLPALKDYEFAGGYCVEMYDNPNNYPKGVADENYYTEVWIPVKKK